VPRSQSYSLQRCCQYLQLCSVIPSHLESNLHNAEHEQQQFMLACCSFCSQVRFHSKAASASPLVHTDARRAAPKRKKKWPFVSKSTVASLDNVIRARELRYCVREPRHTHPYPYSLQRAHLSHTPPWAHLNHLPAAAQASTQTSKPKQQLFHRPLTNLQKFLLLHHSLPETSIFSGNHGRHCHQA
jgi:hypothetical protein